MWRSVRGVDGGTGSATAGAAIAHGSTPVRFSRSGSRSCARPASCRRRCGSSACARDALAALAAERRDSVDRHLQPAPVRRRCGARALRARVLTASAVIRVVSQSSAGVHSPSAITEVTFEGFPVTCYGRHSDPGLGSAPQYTAGHPGRRAGVRVVSPAGSRHVEERPPQQDAAAGGAGQRQGRFLKEPDHAARPGRIGCASSNGQYFITESYLTGREQEHRVEYTLGSRRIQHYLTTIENGRIIVLPPSWDVQRHEWFDNMDIVRPDEDDQQAVPAVEQELRRLPCQPAGEQLPAGDEDVRHALGGLRHLVRALSRARAAHTCSATPVRRHRPPSAPAVDRSADAPRSANAAAWCARSAIRCATWLRPASGPARTTTTTSCPVLEYGRGKDSDPELLGRRTAAPVLERRHRTVAERVLPARRRDLHDLPHDPHQPDVDRHPQLAASNNALCTRCHRTIGARLTAHTRHRADSAGSSCVECHMPKTVVSIRATMRDHTMSLPAPENTSRSASRTPAPSATPTRRRRGRSRRVREWWPQEPPREDGRARQGVHRRARRPARGRRAPDRHRGRRSRRARSFRRTRSDIFATSPDPRAVAALAGALKSGHPAIRFGGGREPGTAAPSKSTAARAAILAALDDPRRAVRIAALVSLVNLGGGPFDAARRQTVPPRVSGVRRRRALARGRSGDPRRTGVSSIC